jgi:DNA-binding transcriptional LysR family regulator
MGHEFKSAFEVLHHYTIGAMVSAGLGITFLPSQATILLLTSRNLKVVPFGDAGFARPVGVITRQGESLSAVAEAFCAFTIKSMLTMTPGGTAPKKPARRRAGTAAGRAK